MHLVRMVLATFVFLAAGAASAEVRQLPLSADYCAILRAFTNSPDPACPAAGAPGALRSVSRAAVPPGHAADEQGYFIRFAFDSDALTADYQSHLQNLSAVLRSDAMAGLCLLLVGHTDSAGDAGYNARLSERRARTVRVYLEGVAGITPARLGTLGRGESAPLSGIPPADPLNRRVEILAKPQGESGCG